MRQQKKGPMKTETAIFGLTVTQFLHSNTPFLSRPQSGSIPPKRVGQTQPKSLIKERAEPCKSAVTMTPG